MKIHLGGNIYHCGQCGKKLLNNNLEFHVSIHSWEKPYQCSECNKIFKTKVGTYMPVLNTLREKKTFSNAVKI